MIPENYTKCAQLIKIEALLPKAASHAFLALRDFSATISAPVLCAKVTGSVLMVLAESARAVQLYGPYSIQPQRPGKRP